MKNNLDKSNSLLTDTRLSVEFRLLAILARINLSPSLMEILKTLSKQSPNWQKVLLMAESHGVVPLVTRNLKKRIDGLSFNETILKQAEAATKSWAIKSFFLASELLRLQNQFQLAGIPFIAFKGPALAQQAFGDPTIRTYSDLDLIISPEQLAPAVKVLLSMGLVALPARSPVELDNLLKTGLLAKLTHEHTFIKADTPIRDFPLRVDLHWNIAPISFEQIEYADIAADAKTVPLCGQHVNTLSDERCLVALSIHATKHQFADLKWLVDIAELAQQPNLDWNKIESIAIAWKATRMVDLAIYLASRLNYDLQLKPKMAARLANNSDLEQLASKTVALWAKDEATRQSNLCQYYAYSCRAFGSLHRACLFLLYELFSPNIVAWQSIKLPANLFPFYYVLSPIILAWNFLVRKKPKVEINVETFAAENNIYA